MSDLGRSLGVLRRKSLRAIPTVVAIVIINFLLLQLAPGDAADVMAAESGAATLESLAAFRAYFRLDLPIAQRLWEYLYNLSHLSLGFSPRFNAPVIDLILERLPGTLLLMGTALVIALGLGIALGVTMAMFAGRVPDRVVSVLALLFYSIPGFWIGLMLIVLFSVKLQLLPSGGAGLIGAQLQGVAAIVDKLRHLVLPATALGLLYVAIYARLTRAAMLEAMSQDYVRTAAAKGIGPVAIAVHHVLRNALLPVTTVAGMHLGGMLGGAVVVETVYSWPGLGRLAFEAVLGRDFNVLLGVLFLSSLVVVVADILTDLLHAWLDPRIEIDT